MQDSFLAMPVASLVTSSINLILLGWRLLKLLLRWRLSLKLLGLPLELLGLTLELLLLLKLLWWLLLKLSRRWLLVLLRVDSWWSSLLAVGKGHEGRDHEKPMHTPNLFGIE